MTMRTVWLCWCRLKIDSQIHKEKVSHISVNLTNALTTSGLKRLHDYSSPPSRYIVFGYEYARPREQRLRQSLFSLTRW